ncbi:SIMPL domain-containing protein [Antribacter gilvus]|uniref:SIMPL domain-containing protein n=1 Tax=Antribacter gilvus TaxID=2304675 RepID=UPI000F7AA87B|nr:SIMPL domain-containing protein [Antribacter gilvus]
MTRISVEGHARRTHPAELGTVRLSVTFSGADRSEVADAAGRVHSRLVDQAREHASSGAATRWDASSVHAFSFEDWVKPEAHQGEQKVRRFRASAGLSVVFADFDALSAWITDVLDTDGVDLGGVEWDLTEETRDTLLAEVRTEAARETAERAQAYAAALGLGEVRPVAVFEDGLRPGVGGPGVGHPERRMFAMAADAGPQLELSPGDLEVTARVTADYEASAPVRQSV